MIKIKHIKKRAIIFYLKTKRSLTIFFKTQIFEWINNEQFNNIYVFFFDFFLKNIKINGILLLLLFLACDLYFYHHPFVSGCLLGIVGSAFASFNLIDGYKEYKNRNAKIIILSYLKSETDGLLETMIGYVKIVFEKIKNNSTNDLQKDCAMNIEFAACYIYVKHNNSKKIKLVNDIENISKSIFNYCVKYHAPQDSIDFSVAISKLTSIKEIVSSQLIIVNDEFLLETYTELILIMSQINSKDLPENIPIIIGGGKDIKLIIDCLYLLRGCYDNLLSYEMQINKYTKERNNKHTRFFNNH